jgi:hypothetical protein
MARKIRGRFLVSTVRDAAYETVIAALSMSTGWRILRSPNSVVSAIMQHAPSWEARGFAVGLMVGGALTLVGLAVAGLAIDSVRRTVGRRVEEFGQIILAGMFVAPALAAFQLGSPGLVQGLFDLGVSAAAVFRVLQMRAVFSAPLPTSTEPP